MTQRKETLEIIALNGIMEAITDLDQYHSWDHIVEGEDVPWEELQPVVKKMIDKAADAIARIE